MINFSLLFRRSGIRRMEHIVNPPLTPIAEFELPRNSLVHYIPEEDEVGPTKDSYLFNGIERFVFMDHVSQLVQLEGSPRPVMMNYLARIREYHRVNPVIKWLKKPISAVTDPLVMLMVSYTGLNDMYVYRANPLRHYYEWSNRYATIWDKAAQIATSSERHQFIICQIPERIPTLSDFQKATSNLSITNLRGFVGEAGLTLLDLWLWIGPEREKSLLSKIPRTALERMNIIWLHKDKWVIMNLGVVNEWRESGEVTEDTDSKLTGVDPQVLQKRFLRFTLAMSGIQVETAPVATPTEIDSDLIETSPEANRAGLFNPRRNEKEKDALVDDGLVNDKDDLEGLLELPPVDDAAIDEDLEAHEELFAEIQHDEQQQELVQTEDDVGPYVPPSDSLDSIILNRAKDMTEAGVLSAAEYRRFSELANRYKELPNPFGPGTLQDLITIKPESVKMQRPNKIRDIKSVFDKSMLKSSLLEFDSRYIDEVLLKDVGAAIVTGAQKAGAAITGLTVEEERDAMNHFHVITVNLAPVAGKPSTARFKIPVVGNDATVLSGGVNYYLKKQRGDLPIRKAAANRVALTSYYGKVFVERSETVANNFGRWITNLIAARGLDNNPPEGSVKITEMKSANAFDHRADVPRIYSILSQRFKSFTITRGIRNHSNILHLFLDYGKRHDHFGKEVVDRAEKGGYTMIGTTASGDPVIVAPKGSFGIILPEGIMDIGKIEDVMRLPPDVVAKAPIDFALVNIFGKGVAVAAMLGYKMGLSTLIKTLGVKPRRVPSGHQLNLEPHEFRVRFKDQSLIFSDRDPKAAMVLAGLNMYHRSLVKYTVKQFDRKDVYLNLLEESGLGVRYAREMDLIYDMFVDHITKELLIEMKEPTDVVGLLFRSVELLQTDKYSDETDLSVMRIKGYERFAGAIYSEMVKAARIKASHPVMSRSSLEINPEAVKMAILMDSSLEVSNNINPIHNLKQKEVVTFGGTGGRSTKTMVKRTRVFHDNDVGVISEATVDSGDVGIITYLTADPKFTSLRGTAARFDKSIDGLARMLSTSALLSPSADNDDPKRVNFVNIQQSHVISAKGYRASPLRTGYEQVLAHRTDDLFATTAKQSGEITGKTDKSLTITYADGSIGRIELGRRFGKSAGSTIPHMVVTKLNVGDKFQEGDLIAYNENFFEPDLLDPKQVAWKGGVLVKTAIMESPDTFEDSSAISERIAKEMMTQTSHIRSIVVDFDQAIHKLVKTGESVDVESILCTIEDAITTSSGLFDDESLETLRLLSNAAPKAKYTGKVEQVEIFYNGSIEDMSESLAELANASDRSLIKLNASLGKPKITGKVDGAYRIDGKPLGKNQLVVNIYITSDVPAGVGDKGVFGNQMKTIFGRVMTGINETESGVPIDAIFGYQSISNRIVQSPEIMGTTNTLLRIIGKHVANIYKG